MRKRLKLKRSRVGIDQRRWLYRSPYSKRLHVYQSAPLLHEAFKHWIKANQPRLGMKLKISGRRGKCLSVRLVGSPDCFSVSISPAEISVAVSLEGQFVDYLLCLDMSAPVIDGGQVFCELCHPESRTLYPSLEAYWQGHEFDRFGDWLTNKLTPAKWLGIYRNWAELTMDEPKGDELIKAIQLR